MISQLHIDNICLTYFVLLFSDILFFNALQCLFLSPTIHMPNVGNKMLAWALAVRACWQKSGGRKKIVRARRLGGCCEIVSSSNKVSPRQLPKTELNKENSSRYIKVDGGRLEGQQRSAGSWRNSVLQGRAEQLHQLVI